MKEIVTYPSPILQRYSRAVEVFGPKLLRSLTELVETMERANGMGLSAPQVGISERFCVVRQWRSPALMLVNPMIMKMSDEMVEGEEGCLSLPGVRGHVTRHSWVYVWALTWDGEPLRFRAEGLAARVIQHEIDHLDGILFTERVRGRQQRRRMDRELARLAS